MGIFWITLKLCRNIAWYLKKSTFCKMYPYWTSKSYIYNGIISSLLKPAKFFNSFFDNLCHQVVTCSWANHTCCDLKGGRASPDP